MYILIFALLIIFELVTLILALIIGRLLGIFIAMCGLLLGMLGAIIAQVDGSIIIATTYNGSAFVNATQSTYPIIFVPILLAIMNAVVMMLTKYGNAPSG